MSKIKFREDGLIVLSDVRLSYPHLFEPWKKEGDAQAKPRFSATFIMPKETHKEEIRALKFHLEQMCKENNKPKGQLVPADKFCLRNGNLSGKDELKECWYVASGEQAKRPPQIRSRSKKILTEDDGTIYAGCYVNAIIRPWWQDNVNGKRVNAGLVAVQFFRDGDRFGAAPPDVDDAFEEYEDFAASEFDDDVSDFGDDDL